MYITQQGPQQSKLMKEQVLALDVAVHCGYYNPLIGGGTLNLTETGKHPKQHEHWFDTLNHWIDEYDIKAIVTEDVSDGDRFMAVRKLAELRGILFLVCDLKDLPEPTTVNPVTLKNWATGNGHASKQQMIHYAKMRWGIDCGKDDNFADAVHLYFYYVKHWKL